MLLRRILLWAWVWLLLLSTVASAHGGINPRDFPGKVEGKHFTVLYASSGPNQVTREYAAKVLGDFEKSYDRLVTKGGMRPPRVEPVTVVLQAAEQELGGLVSNGRFGFELYVQINPRSERANLSDVITHEFFHVLQASYQNRETHAVWAIEGTAPVPSLYVHSDSPVVKSAAMRSHLSGYWNLHRTAMKETKYTSSLFWYWLSEQYGGVEFLRRLLEWSEDLGWERAAQLAAIQGGAPADTTFDRLWRSFVLAMVDGRMPKGYAGESWFDPQRITWSGIAAKTTHGESVAGITTNRRRYAYRAPLVLVPYSFNLIEITADSFSPFALSVKGDPSVEAYVIKPGPGLKAALDSYDSRPQYKKPKAPPADPATVAARLEPGQPVRLGGAPERYLLLVLRTGHWGGGGYSVQMEPVPDGTAAPKWESPGKLPHAADSPASPPALTKAELAALQKGALATGASDLVAEELGTERVVVLSFQAGDTTVFDGEQEVRLPVPITKGGNHLQVPLKAMVQALGGKVEGNRLILGEKWIIVTPGQSEVQISGGSRGMSGTPVQEKGGDLVGEVVILAYLNVQVTMSGSVQELTYPSPRR